MSVKGQLILSVCSGWTLPKMPVRALARLKWLPENILRAYTIGRMIATHHFTGRLSQKFYCVHPITSLFTIEFDCWCVFFSLSFWSRRSWLWSHVDSLSFKSCCCPISDTEVEALTPGVYLTFWRMLNRFRSRLFNCTHMQDASLSFVWSSGPRRPGGCVRTWTSGTVSPCMFMELVVCSPSYTFSDVSRITLYTGSRLNS